MSQLYIELKGIGGGALPEVEAAVQLDSTPGTE